MIKLFEEHESSFIDSVNQKLRCSITRYDYYKSKQACLKQAKQHRKYFRVISQNPIFGL
jgi:hypothetical protein